MVAAFRVLLFSNSSKLMLVVKDAASGLPQRSQLGFIGTIGILVFTDGIIVFTDGILLFAAGILMFRDGI